MSLRTLDTLMRYLRRRETAPSEDPVLLERFVASRDRDAFELLVARHGPMVLGTARRLVGDTHDAEDVFQAVFLSLARLAGSIRNGRTLPAWLYQTTCRISAKVRTNRSAPLVEVSREQPDPGAELVWREVRTALDEELAHLPERFRTPLVLCYLSGLTRDEAAQRLGWSLGTLKRRLEEGRERLRVRLMRRGIGTAGLALAVLEPGTLHAAVQRAQVDTVLRLVFGTGSSVPAPLAAYVLVPATAKGSFALNALLAIGATVLVGIGVYVGAAQVGALDANDSERTDATSAALAHDPPTRAGANQLAGPIEGSGFVRCVPYWSWN